MSKGMRECVVCHREFALIFEDHYIAKDPTPTGLVGLAGGTVYPYDAIDCPHCGCQNVLQRRKPFVCPCDYGICDECDCECVEESDEAEEEDEQGPSIEEMTEFLCNFCHDHENCHDCPLHTPAHKCGRGVWFNEGMTPEQIATAYKDVKEAK